MVTNAQSLPRSERELNIDKKKTRPILTYPYIGDRKILWHVDPLLRNDSEISTAPQTSVSTATEERCFLCCPCRDVLSKPSEGSIGESDNVWGSVVSCCCEKLVAEAGDNPGSFGRVQSLR
jgi:hypothetical protein